MTLRYPSHMGLVEQAVLPRGLGWSIAFPVETEIGHYRTNSQFRAVANVWVDPARHQRLMSGDRTGNAASVRIGQELGRVAPNAFLRLPRTMDPKTVFLAARDCADTHFVSGVSGRIEDHAFFDSVAEEAELDFLRVRSVN